VLVVGAGGLGVPVLSCLAGAGVGTLGIVEERVIESLDEARFGLIDARPA
jgi:sulfur-carrier protein adenylyltransferase/sulfurtransferase